MPQPTAKLREDPVDVPLAPRALEREAAALPREQPRSVDAPLELLFEERPDLTLVTIQLGLPLDVELVQGAICVPPVLDPADPEPQHANPRHDGEQDSD